MKNKEDNFKEKFKLALTSTAKVISDDYTLGVDKKTKNLSSKNIDFFELDNLNTKSDFIKARAVCSCYFPVCQTCYFHINPSLA